MASSQTLTNSAITSDAGAKFGSNILSIMKTLLLLPGDLVNTSALQTSDAIKILITHYHSLAKERDNNLSDLKFLLDDHIFVERNIK